MTNAEAWFNIALRPRKPEGSLGRTAQDGHLNSHTQLLNYLPGCGEKEGYILNATLRASLSGTSFLQTLPDLVTPLEGTLYLRTAVHRRGQRPPKGSGTVIRLWKQPYSAQART